MKTLGSVLVRWLAVAMMIVVPVAAQAIEKPKNTKQMTFYSGGKPYDFWTASSKYSPQEEVSFFKGKFDSCLLATKDHNYCLCMINYYFQDHGLTRDQMMDMDNAFNRVIRDKSGRIVPGLVDRYRADPAFGAYFDYARRAALSCSPKLKKR